MTAAIELAFVIAGLVALMWAIMSPNAGVGSRAAAGSFGIVALLIAMLLHAEDSGGSLRPVGLGVRSCVRNARVLSGRL
jgi:hypothetical protein